MMAGVTMIRSDRHDRISGALAARDDDDLAALVAAGSVGAVGVGGGSSIIDVDGVPVFAKRIPITDRELAYPQSTANLFDIPTYCQYGMYRLAGPGFGAWRELAANRIVTEGVLAGETEAFPLLHRWRVLPGRAPIADEHLDIDAVVTQFGGSPGVRRRFEDLAGATASLVLFHEFIPDPISRLLADPVGQAESVERQLFDTVAFMRDRELLHLDGHFGNMRADGDRIYLADFGLATSPRFDLSDAERDFVAHHVGHDAGLRCDAAGELAGHRRSAGCRCRPGRRPGRPQRVRAAVRGRRRSRTTCRQPWRAFLARHAPAAARMNDFCWRTMDGELHAQYPPAA